jgi:hypothetical protein
MDNINVLEILKLGLPGLVFLMSVLTYRLIEKEQKKEQPNSEVIRLIKHFRNTSLVFAILTMFPPVLEHYFFTEKKQYEQIPIVAFTDEGNLERGVARVCDGAPYYGHYLLITDTVSQSIAQVHAKHVLGCTQDQKKIILSRHDTQSFNWQSNSAQVLLLAANKGQKYVVDQ